MIQSYIYLTQTSLNLEKLTKLISSNFFIQQNFDINREVPEIDEDLYQKRKSSGQILIEDFDSKEDLKVAISSYYQKYNQPTLLFLGNLDSYSQLLQEGMLKLLEEPPANLFLICFAFSKNGLLPTISSRSKIINLKSEVVGKYLDLDLIEKTKKLFPPIEDIVKKMLKNEQVGTEINFTKLERLEIQSWLWQLEYYLTQIYKNDPKEIVAKSLARVVEAQKLNIANLQKKFVVGWLNVN